jgi:hypothetical protein
VDEEARWLIALVKCEAQVARLLGDKGAVRVTRCRRNVDFFTVETAFLKKLYVLFFIEVGARSSNSRSTSSRRTTRPLTWPGGWPG